MKQLHGIYSDENVNNNDDDDDRHNNDNQKRLKHPVYNTSPPTPPPLSPLPPTHLVRNDDRMMFDTLIPVPTVFYF